MSGFGSHWKAFWIFEEWKISKEIRKRSKDNGKSQNVDKQIHFEQKC